MASILPGIGNAKKAGNPGIRESGISREQPLLLTVFIGSSAASVTHECQALPDTGATRSVVSYQLLSDAGLVPSIEPLPRSIRLRTADGSVVPLDGHIMLFISTGSKLIKADALVTSHVKEKLFISWHDLRELAVIPKDFPLSSCAYLSLLDSNANAAGSPLAVLDAAMETIKKDFSDVLGDQLDFDDAGMACPPMKIHMRDDIDVKPINVKVARQVPLHLRDMANKVVDDLVDSKRITRVTVALYWQKYPRLRKSQSGQKQVFRGNLVKIA